VVDADIAKGLALLQGASPDYASAEKLFEASAFRKVPQGMYEYGRLLKHHPDRFHVGLDWLKQASDAGWADASAELGWLYCRGSSSIRRDYGNGFRFLIRAVVLNHRGAMTDLAELLMGHSDSYLPTSVYEVVRFLLTNARDQGSSSATGLLNRLDRERSQPSSRSRHDAAAFHLRDDQVRTQLRELLRGCNSSLLQFPCCVQREQKLWEEHQVCRLLGCLRYAVLTSVLLSGWWF
jgi:TPR repeat protein